MKKQTAAPTYTIRTARLGLRPYSSEDLDTMAALNADPRVMTFFPAVQSRQQTAEFIKRMQKHYNEKGFCYFAADFLETGECIGFIGLMTQSYLEDGNFVDVGWRIKPEFWGRGLAPEGAKACIHYAFEKGIAKSIYAVCPIANKNSERVMQKIGMRSIRTFKHPYLSEYPDIEDCLLYGIGN